MGRQALIAAFAAGAVALGLAAAGARAQGYPERTVEITVPSSPGATAYMLGRVLAAASPTATAPAVRAAISACRPIASSRFLVGHPDGRTDDSIPPGMHIYEGQTE